MIVVKAKSPRLHGTVDDVLTCHLFGLGFVQTEFHVLFDRGLFALQNVRQQHLVEFGERKAAELLGRGHERDVADHLKSGKNRLGFGVLHVGHFKAALQHVADVKEAAIDAAQNHVAQIVDIDVTALDEFLFLAGKIELLVERLREVALDKRALRRNERAVEVCVFTVAKTQHVVGVLTQLLERLCVGLLVVAVFGVGVGHFLVLQEGEHGDHHFVELGNRHLFAMFHTAVDLIGDLVQVVGVNDLVAAKGRLLDGALDFLGIETLDGVVFFYYFRHLAHHPLRGRKQRIQSSKTRKTARKSALFRQKGGKNSFADSPLDMGPIAKESTPDCYSTIHCNRVKGVHSIPQRGYLTRFFLAHQA